MDGILSLPWTARRSYLRVPLLTRRDGHPRNNTFDDIPKQYGIARVDSIDDLIQVCTTAGSLASFLQAWLFFGTLSSFLGRDISNDDFEIGGYVSFCEGSCHRHFRAWRARLSTLSYTRKQVAYSNLQNLLAKAWAKCDILEEAADHLSSDAEEFDHVALSVRLLINTLNAMLDDTFAILCPPSAGPWLPWASYLGSWIPNIRNLTLVGRIFSLMETSLPFYLKKGNLALMSRNDAKRHVHKQANRFRPFPPGVEGKGRAANRLLRLFVENGWCPYRAVQLCQAYDYLVLNSLATLMYSSERAEDHTFCLEQRRCCSHDLAVEGPTDYPFRHECDGTRPCEFIHVPREEINDIIRSKGIPLISVSLAGDLDLRVHKCTPWTTYTAISHVWSDGLGNPRANALPRCQLIRLRQQIFETYFPEYSPYFDASPLGTIVSAAQWAMWKSTRANKPYEKIDKERVYFWMDTLCIPVPLDSEPSEDETGIRFRAMKSITPVFAGALNTFVLDQGLQAVSFPDCKHVQGDEFAAVIIASNWMRRGWTLEEGSLASSTVFQIMGKPYPGTQALYHLLPELQESDSPLERVSVLARLQLPQLLNRALFDEKKQLANDPLSSRGLRLTRMLRVPQFVWTWNSLLERSTTKPQDGPVILGTLLDFNVYRLKSVPHQDTLRHLIQNCNELPLSLFYNTGPRIFFEGHPELGWIPQNIAGDHLVLGASVRKIKSKEWHQRKVKFWIDTSDCNRTQFLILTTTGENFPYNVQLFKILARSGRDNAMQEYIIEVHRSLPQGLEIEDSRKSCLFLDLSCGTSSRSGYSGKGVLFHIDSSHAHDMSVSYDAPFTFWTIEQWQRNKTGPMEQSIPAFEMETVPCRQKLILSYDATLWNPVRLFRRPFLTQHPLGAKIIGIFFFIVVLLLSMIVFGYCIVKLRDALGIKRTPAPIGAFVVAVTGPVIALLIYSPIRRRIAMYTYITWLKSFDEGDEDYGTEEHQGWTRRGGSIIAAFLSRIKLNRSFPTPWKRNGPPSTEFGRRGVTQVSIRLPSRGQQRNVDESLEVASAHLPGEVYLD